MILTDRRITAEMTWDKHPRKLANHKASVFVLTSIDWLDRRVYFNGGCRKKIMNYTFQEIRQLEQQHAEFMLKLAEQYVENARLREAASAARLFLRVHYTMSNESANRISYEIDKQMEILKQLDLVLETATVGERLWVNEHTK